MGVGQVPPGWNDGLSADATREVLNSAEAEGVWWNGDV